MKDIRMSTLLVLAVIMVTAQAQPPADAICKLAYIFGAEGKSAPFNVSTTAIPFCKNVNASCCSESDYQKMYNLWENPKQSNIRNNRTNEMKDILNILSYLKIFDNKVVQYVALLRKLKFTPDPACSSPAFVQGSINKLQLIDTALLQFNLTSKQCWSYTKNLMNGLMCASCDMNAQNYIDTKNKMLIISNAECFKFIDACGQHFKAIHAIFFYFNIIYRLTFCDPKGYFKSQQIPQMVEISAKMSKAINGCLNVKNKDDCATICKAQMSFSTMMKYEYEHKPKLENAMETTVKYLNLTSNRTVGKQETPATKRLLPDSNLLASIKELDSYSLSSAKYGLEFSQYFQDDKDGYTDINLTLVFSANIYKGFSLIVLLWALMT
jgi:hypothetical protein